MLKNFANFSILSVIAFSVPVAIAQSPIEKLDEAFVKESLALTPAFATAQGLHEFEGVSLDEQLDDLSSVGQDRARAVYHHFLAELFLQSKRGDLTEEDRADLEVIRLACQSQLFELDEARTLEHNPTQYVEIIGNALYTPLIQDYAPLEKRLMQIIKRTEAIPQFIATAKENLKDAPEIWDQVAQQENAGNIDLLEHEIRAKIPPAMRARYDAAASAAIVALRDFDNFLKHELTKHQSDWRLGQQKYADKFKFTLATGDTPEQALHDAEAKLNAIRQDMRTQAAALFPRYFPSEPAPQDLNTLVSRVLDKIAHQHTSPDKYFDEAKRDLAEATNFVREKNLLALPRVDNLQVIPTPEFERGIYGVGGFSPAPALEPQLGAYYWITPFTPDMTPERVESKLREYNTWGLQILTIHEAMPGHFVQFQYAAEVKPKWRGVLREVYSNGPYVEGWAVYATQLLIEQGYENSPEMKLTFGKQMLRVVSNTILDIRLQTMGMTDQQALDLMIDQTFQEKEEAVKKLQRAKLSSCQLPTYFVGWRGWNQVRNAYKQAHSADFSLPGFHDRALREGGLPLPELEKLVH